MWWKVTVSTVDLWVEKNKNKPRASSDIYKKTTSNKSFAQKDPLQTSLSKTTRAPRGPGSDPWDHEGIYIMCYSCLLSDLSCEKTQEFQLIRYQMLGNISPDENVQNILSSQTWDLNLCVWADWGTRLHLSVISIITSWGVVREDQKLIHHVYMMAAVDLNQLNIVILRSIRDLMIHKSVCIK